MPTYEYACKDCGEHLEVVQSFKEDALTVCPACGGTLKKVFGAIGVVFKGSGFYKTDSRPAAKTDTGKTDKGKSDKKDSTSSSSTSSSSSSSESSSSPSSSGDTKASTSKTA